jgi:hypothetical protein
MPDNPFFTVRATMFEGERGETNWTFLDQREAEKKFNEVCGPLCTEAWLISWTDHPSIRGKKQVYLRRHWTAFDGADETPTWLCDVNTRDEDTLKQTNEDLSDTQIDWDTLFDTTPDDSDIFLFVDPDQFTSDNTYGHFEVGFRKFTFGRNARFPDYESCFHGLTFSCQWDSNLPVGETYAWNVRYRNVGVVELKRAQHMAEMLEKIQRAEKSLPSRPRSFGEYVAVMTKGLGLKSDVAAYGEKCDSGERESPDTYAYPPLNGLELQNLVNQLIANRRQSEQNKRAPGILPISEDNAGGGELSRRMTKPKNAIAILGALVLLYAGSWVLGEHGHTYNVEPAKEATKVWRCAQGQDGPFWENGTGRDHVCHEPARQCPMLWFPWVTQVPCPYKDQLGGPYTEGDLFLLKQMQNPRR